MKHAGMSPRQRAPRQESAAGACRGPSSDRAVKPANCCPALPRPLNPPPTCTCSHNCPNHPQRRGLGVVETIGTINWPRMTMRGPLSQAPLMSPSEHARLSPAPITISFHVGIPGKRRGGGRGQGGGEGAHRAGSDEISQGGRDGSTTHSLVAGGMRGGVGADGPNPSSTHIVGVTEGSPPAPRCWTGGGPRAEAPCTDTAGLVSRSCIEQCRTQHGCGHGGR